ncbi:uncharacterized protein LOC117318624 isoform X1 [Pecten maximus]|uniref:uncharacterized protein LOC117318624 isoform X1 n=1 Tax=Pecten maximus TaxID=6579 RepID=UPI0014588E34|nr:uncharacterized protein LOC117318624 isoform X1 [Pecten maximus]
MASLAVACGGFIALVLFILQTVGVATNHWYVVEVLTGSSKITIGLFRICVEINRLGSSASQCFTYSSYSTTRDLLSFNYYAITGLSVIGCILLFTTIIVAIVGCVTTRPDRPTIKNLSGIWFCSSGCTIAAVIWFYFTQYNNSQTLLSLTSLVEVSLGYSFYLVVIAGGGTLIAAITMCVMANNMDVPQTATPVPFVAPAGQQVIVMHSGVQQQGPAGNPQPGYIQPGYPQSGFSQPGYTQPGYSQPGYPQPGYAPNVPGYAGQPMANSPQPMK